MAGEGEGAGTEVVVEEIDVRDAIGDSITEARERLASGESLIPQEEDTDVGGEAEEDVEDVHVEDDAAEAPPADESGEAGAADVEDEEGEPGALEGEPPDAEEELDEEGPDGEGEEAEPEVVALPGRRPDDPELEIEVDDPETAERIRQLKNMGLRGQEYRERMTEIEDREAEQEFIDTELATDPAGFLMERVRPELQKEVLLALLAENDLYEDPELQDQLREWEIDPEAREEFAKEHGDERKTKAQQRKQRAKQQRKARSAVRDIAQNVISLIPDGMERDRQDRFYRSAMRAAEAEVMRTGSLEMDRTALIDLLDHEGLLQGYSIDPEKAASTSEAAARNGSRRSRATARSRKGEPVKERPTKEEARSTGERLKARSKRRKEAAAAAPAGAGAPAASIELPEGQSVKERIKTVRAKGGLAAFLDG